MSSAAESQIKEIQLDVNELKSLLSQATRNKVKQVLNAQIESSQNEIARLQKSEQDRLARLSNASNIGYVKKIDSYGWDQSEKFVKIYITGLKELDKLKEGDVTCQFDTRSLDLTIKHLNNISHNLTINNLLNSIDASQSYFKVKSDMVTVFLKKVETSKSWSYLTEKEAKLKDKPMSMPKMDENADPQEGLMSMMKKMYEEGDDEMKRTISKAFVEGREKSGKGGLDDMGGLGGLGGLAGMGGMGGF